MPKNQASLIHTVQHPKSSYREKNNQIKIVGWILFTLGLLGIATSIVYTNEILAFVGLGLTFWGPLILYLTSEDYVKKTLFISTASSSINNLNRFINELEYKGEPVFLPPKFLENSEDCKIYISKNKSSILPFQKTGQKIENGIFLKKPKGLLLEPSGLDLCKLFESALKKKFTQLSLNNLNLEFSKLFVDDLEIAKEIQLEYITENNSGSSSHKLVTLINIEIVDTIYTDLCNKTINKPLSCPITSAIGCSLAKVTGKPIIVENINVNTKTRTIKANFRLLEKVEHLQTEILLPQIGRLLHSPTLSTSSLIIMGIGSLILLWTGYLILLDLMVWGKDFIQIIFAARPGELINLGLGLRIIHYLITGSGLLISGLTLHNLRSYAKQKK